VACRPADTNVCEAVFDHDIRIVKIPAVNDDWITEGLVQTVEIQSRKFGPVRKDQESISFLRCSVGTSGVAEIRRGRKNILSPLDCRWVISGDRTTFRKEHFDNLNRRRFPDVVGFALEGQPQNTDAFPAERPQSSADLIQKALLLLIIDLLNFNEEAKVDTQLLCHRTKSGHVLGETGAAVADTGTKKFRTDTAVKTHTASHLLDVRICRFAKIRDSIDERNLHS
jgi:hypothetical protein